VRVNPILALALVLLTGAAAAQTNTAPDQLLQRGIGEYRAAKYAEAITDLRAASSQFLNVEQKQKFVDSGVLPTIKQLEQALVYLALAYAKTGREADAMDAVTRLLSAEKMTPAYASLPLGCDAAELESLAARLVPSEPLPHNTQLAAVDDKVAAAIADIEKDADARIAEARKAADARVAAAIAAAQKAADERIAAGRAAIQKAADARIAAERAAIEKATDERIAADRAAAVAAAQRIAGAKAAAAARVTADRNAERREVTKETPQSMLASLRKADASAKEGDFGAANRVYTRLATASNAPREVIASSGVGLYRIGDFAGAAAAFGRLGTFVRGEEDLRYYDAVALYETGRYDEAKKQLACALPYIQITDDVTRYRTKIEQTPTQQAMR